MSALNGSAHIPCRELEAVVCEICLGGAPGIRAPLPPLHGVRAFVATAHAGSFSAAAVDLGFSAAAISQAVRDLEQYLQRQLFDRDARGVRLTREGRLLLSTASRVIYELALLGER